MTYYQPGNRLIIPLSQTCLAMNGQTIEKVAGGGSGNGALRRFFEMPGVNGNIGKNFSMIRIQGQRTLHLGSERR